MKFGSLFSGIGGMDLGLERAGMECAWQVEIDPFCRRVLAKHWPNVPKYGDIREVNWSEVERPELLCGGFPCQDISSAGQRAGMSGVRSGLWSEFLRAIRALRPGYVVVENVSALLERGIGRVLGDLAEERYDAEWDCVPASYFGLPQARERVWIVAYPGEGRFAADDERFACRPPSIGWPDHDRLGEAQSLAEACAARAFRVDDGIPRWMERTAALGNGAVPQVVEWIGRRIMVASGVGVPEGSTEEGKA